MKSHFRLDLIQSLRVPSMSGMQFLLVLVVMGAPLARGDEDSQRLSQAVHTETGMKMMNSDNEIAARALEEWREIEQLPVKNGRKVVNRALIENNEHVLENAFLNLLKTDYDLLLPMQRPAHLAFVYDGEMQNGGHLQYFTNLTIVRTGGTIQRVDETIRSLKKLGAAPQAEILTRALARWTSKMRKLPASVEDYSATALEGEFDDLDKEYYKCPVRTIERLTTYFRKHEADFILRE